MRLADDPGVPMSSDEQRLLAEVIHERCGIAFADDSRALLRRRLAPRLAALGLPSYAAYHRHLCHAADRAAELEHVVEQVTTHETYFFREPKGLAALAAEVLPELHRRGPRGRHLTVWSAGCATGEEAYSVAILIVDSGLFGDWTVRVFGNDVSRRVLDVARKAAYGKASFRATDESTRRRHFREAGGREVVRDDVRALVSFGHINLLDDELLGVVGEVDVIVCRNVLMYFDLAARRRVAATFARKLGRGGTLLLGHAESLHDVSTAFELVRLEHDTVYRRS